MTKSDSTERFTVTTEELAGMLTSAGCSPSVNSPLPAPAESAGAAPTEGQSRILAVASNPTGELRIVGPGPDRGIGISTSLLWIDSSGPFVIATHTVGGFDLSLLPSRSVALSWLDRALSLTSLPSPPATDRLELDLPGYAALLSLADAVSDVRLREQLERKQRRVAGFSIDHLQYAFDTGLRTEDDRWAVSAARLVCPVDLSTVAGQLDKGLERLTIMGLTSVGEGGIGVTQLGSPFVSGLSSMPRCTGLATALTTTSGIDVSHLTIHRSAIALHIGVWKAVGEQPWLVLTQPSAAGFVSLVDGLIKGR